MRALAAACLAAVALGCGGRVSTQPDDGGARDTLDDAPADDERPDDDGPPQDVSIDVGRDVAADTLDARPDVACVPSEYPEYCMMSECAVPKSACETEPDCVSSFNAWVTCTQSCDQNRTCVDGCEAKVGDARARTLVRCVRECACA